MHIDISRGHIEWNRAARQALHQGIERLRARVRRTGLKSVKFEARFNHIDDQWLEVRMRLVTPVQTIESHQADSDLVTLVREGFGELYREFDRLRLRVDPLLRQKAAERARRRRRAGSLHDAARLRNDLIRDALPILLRTARHELALRQAQGDINPGVLDPADLVEDVLAARLAQVRLSEGTIPAILDLERSLIAHIDAEVARVHDAATTHRSIDTDVPDTLEVSPDGEAIYEFWVPEEDLVLQDLISDPDATNPENVVDEIQNRTALVRALFALPDETRRLFEHVVMDDWSVETVAQHRSLAAREVRAIVDEALSQLGHRLSPDTPLPPEQVRALYSAFGRRLRDEQAARLAEVLRSQPR